MERGQPWRALRRCAARSIDLAIAFGVGFVLSLGPVGLFFAQRAVVMLRIGAPGTIWRGPIPMLLGIAGTFVYALPFACLLVALVKPVLGASPGEALFALGRTGQGDWRGALRRSTPAWGLTAALLLGSWQLAVLALIASLLLPVMSMSASRLARLPGG